IWTDNALKDLDEIGEYISNDSVRYAEKTVEDLFFSTEILESHPKAGPVVPELPNISIRQLIVGNFRIVYEIISKSRIDVLTVHRTSRLIENTMNSND
ncbi:MAG: type II toxin-antitoxin system RelE/ParE family toxin, partial [Bacteroidales bacterium]|nr:type II toxin-antitoxin system RelE/ParE family toxin [Bacteroidales bacterium]